MQQIKKQKPKLTGSLLNIYIHSVHTVRKAGQTWQQWFYFFLISVPMIPSKLSKNTQLQ